MRNLKRALSLALATVMTLGLMVVGTGAVGYTDVTSEDNQEAIEVLQEVGIMTGVTDDEFNPDGLVTRNQMAVIMSQLLNLDYNYYRGINSFTDVPAWAAPYVAACVAEGVTAGIGGGLYGGENNVTAAQAALMIMKALGYFQYQGDFNPDWQVATIRQASQIGLFSGVDSNAEEALTRGQVAQMVLNGLKADMVYFTGDVGTQITVGDITVDSGYRPEYTVRTSSEKKYDSLVGGTTDIIASDKYTIQLGEELYDGKLTEKADRDDFERPATTWRYDYKVIGTYMDEPDLTYTAKVESGDIYSDLGLSKSKTSDEFYIDGKEQTSDFDVIKKDETQLPGTANGVLTQVWYDEWVDENGISRSDLIITEVNTYVGKVNTVTAATSSADRAITLSKASAAPASLNTKFETENFAKNDLVIYTAAWNGSRYDIQTVEVLEKTDTGILTEWNGTSANLGNPDKASANNNFTVDGETYKYSVNAYIVDENGFGSATDISAFDVDESELNVYLDKYGYAIYVSGVEGETNYAAVIGIGETNQYGDEVKGVTLLLPDGTTMAVKAKLSTGLAWSDFSYDAAYPTGKNLVTDGIADLVTYSKGDDDVYTLSFAHTTSAKYDKTYDDLADEIVFVNGKSQFILDDGADGAPYTDTKDEVLYTTSETIFMVATDDGTKKAYNVYIGYENMPSIDDTKASYGISYICNKNYPTQIDVVYLDVQQLAGISSVDTYVVKEKNADIITNSKGDYYVLPAIVDGAETTVMISADYVATSNVFTDKNGSATDEFEKAVGLYALNNVTKNSKDIITGFTVVNGSVFDAANGATGTVAANKVVLGIGPNKTEATYWAYNDKTEVFVVDKDYKTITVSSVADVDTDGNDLVYASHDGGSPEKKLNDVIIVKKDDVVVVAPVVNSLKVNGTAAEMYSTVADAVANPIQVNGGTDVALVATATESGAVKFDLDGGYVSGDFSADYTNVSSPVTVGNAAETVIVRVTATNSAGTSEAVYVALKVVASEELVFTVSNARVEIDGKLYKDGGKLRLPVGTTFSMKVTAADGTPNLTVTYGGTSVQGFGGIYDITVAAGQTAVNVTATAS